MDTTLLGDLFISVYNDSVIDVTNNNKIITNDILITSAIKNIRNNNSIYFNGLGANISIDNANLFKFGIDDFSMDWWEYKLIPPLNIIKNINSIQCSICKKTESSNKHPILVQNDIGQCLYMSSDGKDYDIAYKRYMGDIMYNKWTHWAIVRCNGVFYTFRDGIIKNIWASDKSIDSSERVFTIGTNTEGNNFYGCMNNIRIVRHQALWTEKFSINEELYYYY